MNLDNSLTIRNYKEPLKPIPKGEGFGYYGTLVGTIDGTQVQCHICGKLFGDMGLHARQTHGILNREYRERFELAYQTALISETVRENRKQNTLKWLASLTAEQIRKMRVKQMEGIRKYNEKRGNFQPTIRLETKNKRGTCPDQLLDKIKEVANSLKHTPSLAEFVAETGTQRYKHLIFTTFGSWKNALNMIKLAPKERTMKYNSRRYSDEELLEYLSIFAQENRKVPTFTDFKRGWLPGYDTYVKRWGSIENARQEAGVYQFVEPLNTSRKGKKYGGLLVN